MRSRIYVLALVVSACASYEVPSEVRKADWEAKNIFPTGYRSEILAFLRTYLNDPTNVRDAGISDPVLKPMGLGNRYVSCVRYTPRKGIGGIAGVKEHAAVFVEGKLDRFQELKEANKDRCNGVSYGPFPEIEHLTR